MSQSKDVADLIQNDVKFKSYPLTLNINSMFNVAEEEETGGGIEFWQARFNVVPAM